MVLPTCFINIPALPGYVTVSGYRTPADLAYAPTNTNYFGGTSCGLSSLVTATPYTPNQPTSTAKCTLPPSVSGKAYSVTPVIYVPRTVSGNIYAGKIEPYTCDPIPAASINKGNFQFACKSLRGKDMGYGGHTISWSLPTAAGISIQPFTFYAVPPTSTPKYVINKTKAKTTLVPTTITRVTTMTTVTTRSTVTVTVPTRTTTCFYTVTVTPPASVRRLRRADSSDLELSPRVRRAGGTDHQPDSGPELPMSNSVVVDVEAGHDLAHDSHGTGDSTDIVMDLKERAASATPAIGKPDFTYPPYGVTTIYVKSISTDTWTDTMYSTFWKPGPPATTTISVVSWVESTVTVTGTPVSQSTR